MDTLPTTLHSELLERRRRLQGTIGEIGEAPDLVRLLGEVDAALERVETGTYATCDACHEEVEPPDLLAHPLLSWCLCQLTPTQQEELQRDLDLATRVQWAMLPEPDLASGGWETHFRYLPAGPVSGDYCDVVAGADGDLNFLVGDVMGHGVAASFFTARLNALFRSLLDQGLPLAQLVERANRLFQDRASAEHYATLVCGRADRAGRIELVNAGHCLPLAVRRGRVEAVEGGGLPVGLLEARPYETSGIGLSKGDTLFLYTDGLIEAQNARGEFYGEGRVADFLGAHHSLAPRALAQACLDDLRRFAGTAPLADDLTLLILRRSGDARGSEQRDS